MTRAALTVLLAAAMTGCGHPLLVPTAGPNARGFGRHEAPPPPDVVIASGAPSPDRPAGGAVDSVHVHGDTVVVVGWAEVTDTAPRGRLEISLPAAATGRVHDVVVVPRPDVVAATSKADFTYSGFQITLTVVGMHGTAVCVQSSSSSGEFRLGGSDAGLCRSIGVA